MLANDSFAHQQEKIRVNRISSNSPPRVSGGGARSPFWRQMLADVFGKPVVMLATQEGSAYGAALLASFEVPPNLRRRCYLGPALLTGFVIQGLVPYALTPSQARHKLMLKAAFSGIWRLTK